MDEKNNNVNSLAPLCDIFFVVRENFQFTGLSFTLYNALLYSGVYMSMFLRQRMFGELIFTLSFLCLTAYMIRICVLISATVNYGEFSYHADINIISVS